MLTARNAIAKRSALAVAEFATLRLRLTKIAARVIEGAARIRDDNAARSRHFGTFEGLMRPGLNSTDQDTMLRTMDCLVRAHARWRERGQKLRYQVLTIVIPITRPKLDLRMS